MHLPAHHRVLALDISLRTGWCAGPYMGRPAHGVLRIKGESLGYRMAHFADALTDLVRILAPIHEIWIEAPLVAASQRSAAATRLALALTARAHEVASRAGLRISEESASTARKAILGRGTFPAGEAKGAVGEYIEGMGFRPQDDNTADAILLWLFAEQKWRMRHGH